MNLKKEAFPVAARANLRLVAVLAQEPVRDVLQTKLPNVLKVSVVPLVHGVFKEGVVPSSLWRRPQPVQPQVVVVQFLSVGLVLDGVYSVKRVVGDLCVREENGIICNVGRVFLEVHHKVVLFAEGEVHADVRVPVVGCAHFQGALEGDGDVGVG